MKKKYSGFVCVIDDIVVIVTLLKFCCIQGKKYKYCY